MLSDLEMVAQAMGSSQPNNTTQHISNSAAQQTQSNGLPSDITASLSNLSPPDLAALLPLLSALTTTSSTDLENLSDKDIEDLLAQMDAAEDVADTLERRLDRLLEKLGEVEEDINPSGKEGGGLENERKGKTVKEKEKEDIREIAEDVGKAKEREEKEGK